MSPLLSSCFIFIAIFRQVSPFLPPSFLPLAGPLPHCYAGRVGRRSFHAGAQTFYFQRKPASEGDSRRAGAAQGSGQAASSVPAPARARLAGRTEAPGAAAAAAPDPNVAKCPRPAAEDEEALRCPRPGNGFGYPAGPAALSSEGPSERALSERAEGAPRSQLAAPPPARPPALCGARLGHGRVRGHSSAEGHRARRQPEHSQSARQPHAGGREKEQASVSRKGSHQAKAGERALRGSSEPSGRIVSFHQAPSLLPPS